jgi:hypothetical protein
VIDGAARRMVASLLQVLVRKIGLTLTTRMIC